MNNISAVIITFNEERNIQRCLDSLIPVADDIVVVDSYSTDKTPQIVESKGVRFVQHPFEGHIEQKNWAITQAMHPFVLSLDADEALDKDLQQAILEVKKSGNADGYYLNRLTNYCGTWIWHGNWYPDPKLRLWDSRKGKWGGVNPHDTFIMERGSKISQLPGHLLHYSFSTYAEHRQQIHHFADIASRAAFHRGKRSSPFHVLLSPTVRFLKGYFLKRGFLDGKAGWQIALWSAYAKYLKYRNLQRLWHAKRAA